MLEWVVDGGGWCGEVEEGIGVEGRMERWAWVEWDGGEWGERGESENWPIAHPF